MFNIYFQEMGMFNVVNVDARNWEELEPFNQFTTYKMHNFIYILTFDNIS